MRMEEKTLHEIEETACYAVKEATGACVSPPQLRTHRTKCPIAVSLANRLVCDALRNIYGLQWRTVASLMRRSSGRVRKNVYELDALMRFDEECRRAYTLFRNTLYGMYSG